MSKGINLLGGERRGILNKNIRNFQILRIIAVSLLFGISGFSIILFLLIALSPLPSLQQQEQNAKQNIAAYHEDMAQLLVISDRIQGGEAILKKRTNYAEPLVVLRQQMPAGLNVTSILVEDKTISLTVISSSLQVLESFLTNMTSITEEQNVFSKVILSKFFFSEGSQSFSLTLDVALL